MKYLQKGIKITQLKDKLIGEQSVEGLSAAEILEKNIERKKTSTSLVQYRNRLILRKQR